MQTKSLGPDAPEVAVVGFGGMPLSTSNRPDAATSRRVVHAALDAGVTFLDTADVYCLGQDDIGHNEGVMKDALDSWAGNTDPVYVGTKGGLTRPQGRWERNGRPEHLRAACDHSLQALGVDRIDLYQLHAPDPDVPFAESVGALADLQRTGKIRWVGLSNVSVDQIQEAERIVPVVTVQNRLNPFFREALDDGVVAYCAKRGIGFLAYSPVGGGRLNKKLLDHEPLKRIAQTYDATPHELVLAWVLAQGDSVIIIPGSRSVEHALSATRAAQIELSSDDLRAIDDAEFSRA